MKRHQVGIPAEYVEAFRIEVKRELGFAADALKTRVEENFGSIEGARARLAAAEVLYDQAHEQEGPLMVDMSEALAGTLPFVVGAEAEEMASDAGALASPETFAEMRERLDNLTFWVELIESLSDDLIAYSQVGRAQRHAEIAELAGR